jgi:hypothetical protein
LSGTGAVAVKAAIDIIAPPQAEDEPPDNQRSRPCSSNVPALRIWHDAQRDESSVFPIQDPPFDVAAARGARRRILRRMIDLCREREY